MTDRRTIDQITSDQLDQLYDQLDGTQRMYYTAMGDLGTALNRLDHIRQLHQPTGVVGAAEFGNPPDCTTCGPNRWPCPTYNAITEPAPAATQATEATNPTRVTALYNRWVKAGPPRLGTPIARWWDARLGELHHAILPTTDQPKEQ